ncbi:acylphosphatase-2 [Drosophila subpulchrella]|uniref:acylphosphatase-2 n=1 Tax=Drosophila subpulchrella TaxID=1486046 RepID=UPI0018A1AD07|nr:acylphosphatase-2 [Drosophila subpulchrella]
MNSKITKSKLTSPKLVRSSPKSVPQAAKGEQIFSCQFEVFGHVQGVFFRKHTQKKAKELGITGWCMNTTQGTVKGMLEGSLDQMTDMKYWLQHKGSPRSVIEKAVFSENEALPINNFKVFSIRR